MTESAFDTHREFQRLRDAGFEDKKAEAIIHSMNAVLIGGVATKTDIENLRVATKTDIEQLKTATEGELKAIRSDIKHLQETTSSDIENLKETTATKAELAQSETRTTRWIVGTAMALAGVLIVYLQFIFPGIN